MANVLVNETSLEDIADAIRAKLSSSDTYKPSEMATAIGSISGGGITPTGTKQISISSNGTTTEDVTNYANAEITVSVSGGGSNPSHLVTGSDICISMGQMDWAASKAVLNVYQPNARRAIACLTGTTDVYINTSGTAISGLSDLHLIPIPSGATKTKITVDRTMQFAFREYIETNGAITDSVSTLGWTDITADTAYTVTLTSGTNYIGVTFRANSSGSNFSYSTEPRKVIIDFE